MRRITQIVAPLLAITLAASAGTIAIAARSAAARSHAVSLPADARATDKNVTLLTANLLEQSQFSHRRLDDQMASTFLDRYMDSLDGTRSLFLQPDESELAAYRATLAEATRKAGDTRAAHAIFARYLERLEQRTAYVAETLRTATFDFTGHDVYSFDREHAERPKDAGAAEQLWRQQLRAEYLQEKLRDRSKEQIVNALTRRYSQQLQTMKALRSDEVLGVYLDTLAHVYDPHSDYLGHEEMESFSIAMNLSLFGIGATLENVDGYCKIRELVPGGPAARSGLLRPGDRIVAVAQDGKEPVEIVNLPLARAVELIRGAKGSRVALTIIPADGDDAAPPRTATIVRDEVRLADQEAKARIVDLPTGKGEPLRLGVIELPSFYAGAIGGGQGARSATADVEALLAKLEKEHVRGVVLDLRHNGGGSLKEAITLTGLFIRTGPVVQTRDPSGALDVSADTDPAVQYGGPLVVLTSRFSASASEIVAGALQDYGRAVVVGDTATFGKGTVQNVVPLAPVMDELHLPHSYDPGALKLTISKFYRPSGASTQLRGVASDVVIPSSSDSTDISESRMKNPLPWDTVASAPHDQLNEVTPYVVALRERSASRIATEKDFGRMSADTARLEKTMTTKSVSLNEAERREELARSRARHEERERESRASLDGAPATYTITLENASAPGLPPRTTAANNASKPAPSKEDVDELATARAADETVLRESERILADYVELSAK